MEIIPVKSHNEKNKLFMVSASREIKQKDLLMKLVVSINLLGLAIGYIISPQTTMAQDLMGTKKEEEKVVCTVEPEKPSFEAMMAAISLIQVKSKLPSVAQFQECTCRDFPQGVRDKFREQMLNYISKKFIKKDEPVTITSFASGKLGMEFKLMRDLEKLGYSNVTLNVIDTAYDGVLAPIVDSFQKHVDSWNSSGKNFNLNPLNSFAYYKALIDDDVLTKSDLIIDVDSGGNFEKEKARKYLNKEGQIHSLTSDWIYKDDQVAYGNSLEIIDSDGNESRSIFHLRVGFRKAP